MFRISAAMWGAKFACTEDGGQWPGRREGIPGGEGALEVPNPPPGSCLPDRGPKIRPRWPFQSLADCPHPFWPCAAPPPEGAVLQCGAGPHMVCLAHIAASNTGFIDHDVLWALSFVAFR